MMFAWRTGLAMARQLRDVRAVIFDRDDTLVHDQPGPLLGRRRLEPLPGAAQAVHAARAAGLRVGVVTQSGIGHPSRVAARADLVNARIDGLLGPFDTWQSCTHGPAQGCRCRGPAPGHDLIVRAAHALEVPAHQVVVIADLGSDIRAAQSAGAVGILVPARRTMRAGKCVRCPWSSGPFPTRSRSCSASAGPGGPRACPRSARRAQHVPRHRSPTGASDARTVGSREQAMMGEIDRRASRPGIGRPPRAPPCRALGARLVAD